MEFRISMDPHIKIKKLIVLIWFTLQEHKIMTQKLELIFLFTSNWKVYNNHGILFS